MGPGRFIYRPWGCIIGLLGTKDVTNSHVCSVYPGMALSHILVSVPLCRLGSLQLRPPARFSRTSPTSTPARTGKGKFRSRASLADYKLHVHSTSTPPNLDPIASKKLHFENLWNMVKVMQISAVSAEVAAY